ncbi:MAG: MSHA pilin protein MshA [Methylophagaceae bacterium]|jgi:MSHA pilin protein MshA
MKNSRGFTLIELVMVIVILGILAAVALPKFANLQGEAREGSIRGAYGAATSAMAIVHSQSIINGDEAVATSTVTLEGVVIDVAYGYPIRTSIAAAAGLSSDDYSIDDSTGAVALRANCGFVYTNAGAAAPATIALTVAGC